MNRRGFLGMMIGGIAAQAAVRSFPFRVFSFPTEIIRIRPMFIPPINRYNPYPIGKLVKVLGFAVNDSNGLYLCTEDGWKLIGAGKVGE